MIKIKVSKKDMDILSIIINTYPRIEDNDSYAKNFNKGLERLQESISKQLREGKEWNKY